MATKCLSPRGYELAEGFYSKQGAWHAVKTFYKPGGFKYRIVKCHDEEGPWFGVFVKESKRKRS